MKPDSMLVEPQYIAQSLEKVCERGPEAALEQLRRQEPALAAFIKDRLVALAGRLTLGGAPHPVVHRVHADVLLLVLGSLEALRRGHYELWKDTALAPRLPSPERNDRPRRKPRRPEPEDDIPF